MPLADLDLDAILATTMADYERLVAAWTRDEPGSWGALAGQAIIATRRALGRGLTDAERRLVWQRLWDRLVSLRAMAGPQDTPGILARFRRNPEERS
jgi:hypothetical protein